MSWILCALLLACAVGRGGAILLELASVTDGAVDQLDTSVASSAYDNR